MEQLNHDSHEILYQPQSDTLDLFHKTLDYHHRCIRGPLGSAKTTTVCVDIFDLIMNMPADVNGVRRSRWAAIRNTYAELKETTAPEWLDICGDELGKMNWSDMIQEIEFDREDGTTVRAQMNFKALDKPKDIKKLRGMQLTGAWLNEAKELPFAVVSMAFGRCGRYPRRGEVDPFWFGLVMDTNSPDEDHWWFDREVNEKPEGWVFVTQPGGVIKVDGQWVPNPEADNLHNLPPNYYENQISGNPDDWINVNLANNFGFVVEGKPVHPWYTDAVHCAPSVIEPNKRLEIGIGLDFGRTPAAAFYQEDPAMGRYTFIDEFVTDNMSAETFAPELYLYLQKTYPGFKFRIGWGDPAGDDGNQSTDRTPFQILAKNKINAIPTDTNDPLVRRASLSGPGRRLCMDGKPALMISPKCKMLRKGLAGGFAYRRLQTAGERYSEKPDKNIYSHVCEAAEYGLQGEGEGRLEVVGAPSYTAPVRINKYSPMNRK